MTADHAIMAMNHLLRGRGIDIGEVFSAGDCECDYDVGAAPCVSCALVYAVELCAVYNEGAPPVPQWMKVDRVVAMLRAQPDGVMLSKVADRFEGGKG